MANKPSVKVVQTFTVGDVASPELLAQARMAAASAGSPELETKLLTLIRAEVASQLEAHLLRVERLIARQSAY